MKKIIGIAAVLATCLVGGSAFAHAPSKCSTPNELAKTVASLIKNNCSSTPISTKTHTSTSTSAGSASAGASTNSKGTSTYTSTSTPAGSSSAYISTKKH